MHMAVKGHLGHLFCLFISFEVPVPFQKHLQMLKHIGVYIANYILR